MPEMDNRSEEAEKVSTDIEAQPSKEESEKDTLYNAEQAELSRKAQQMGESRKQMAQTLIELAAESDSAKERLRAFASDPSERAYLEKKFGEQFRSLISDEKVESSSKEEAIPSEKLAALDQLMKERELERRSKISKMKESLGLTLTQADQFDDLLSTFEGKTIGGKPVTLEDAAEMAARQLRPDRQVSFSSRGDVVDRPEDEGDEVKVPIREVSIRRHGRYTKAKSAEDYAPIVKQVAETGKFRLAS